MHLELDGKSLEKHPAARHQANDAYLSNFRHLTGHTPDNAGFQREVYHQIVADSDQLNYFLGKALEHMGKPPLPWMWGSLVNILADRLADVEDILELTPKLYQSDRLPPPADKPGLIPLDLPKTLSLSGSGLKKGIIVYNGNLAELSASEGGIIAVNGDVEKIAGGVGYKSGMIYVDGDVNLLDNMGHMMLAVTGKIDHYKQDIQSPGGLRLPIAHSPFLFNPNQVEGTRFGFLPNQYGKPMIQEKGKPGMVVEKERLEGWRPEEIKDRMMELCRERIDWENQRRLMAAQMIDDPAQLMRFYLTHYEGSTQGYSRGYYDAPRGYSDD
jgi:hypothetical protein